MLLTVFVKGQMLVTFQKTDKECIKGSALVSIQNGVGPFTILWSTGSSSVSINNLAIGTYSVNVKDATLKDTTISFNIDSIPCPVGISSFFTPNDDGYNDLWSISNTSYFPNFELFVFNRWGQTVLHQFDIYIPWNGTSIGLPIPDGTYYYVFYFDKNNKNKILKGDVNILR